MARAAKKAKGSAEPKSGRLNILENAVLVTLHFSNLGNSRKLDAGKVDTDADETMLRVSKTLLDSPEYREVLNHRHQFRWGYFVRKALPSALSGTATFVLPLAILPDIEREYAAFEQKDRELVDCFCQVYPERVADARRRLKSEFDPANYPPVGQVKAAFGVRMAYLMMGTPDNLRSVSGAIYAREQEKFYASLEETAQRIDAFLSESLADLVDWMVARLGDQEDGKRKKFGSKFEAKLVKVQDFLDSFKSRNLTGNVALETLVGKAKALLKGVDADAVKDADYRKRVRDGFAKVKVTLDSMVEVRSTRKISLDEE